MIQQTAPSADRRVLPARRNNPLESARETAAAAYAELWRGLWPLLPAAHAAVGVTSVRGKAGVTTVAAQLAKTAAALEIGPVLLVEGAGRGAGLPGVIEAQSNPGWRDWLRGEADLEACLQESSPIGLCVMTAGGIDADSGAEADRDGGGRAAGGERSSLCHGELPFDAFDQLRSRFALTICDLGDAANPAFPFPLAGKCDGLLLVIPSEGVNNAEARRVKRRLLDGNGRLLGAIWNDAPRPSDAR